MKAEYISHYLTDNDIANFARQSFAKDGAQFTEEQNANLIKYLARGMTSGDWLSKITDICEMPMLDQDRAHDLAVHLRSIPTHWVPFGHPQITLRMTAPIPIRVQCFKHKIGFVESEESRRYISSTPTVFIPEFREKAANVKQGSAGIHPENELLKSMYIKHTRNAVAAYENMLACGVCPEQARFVLPQGCEVNWVWTGSLYAFAHMYRLRADSHAQKEIQELADQIDKIIEPLFPVAWPALAKGVY